MRIFQCDDCGKQEVPEKLGYSGYNSGRPSGWTNLTVSVTSHEIPGMQRSYELCPDCVAKWGFPEFKNLPPEEKKTEADKLFDIISDIIAEHLADC